MRVIVLEDSDIIRNALRERLEDKGYEVFVFANPLICPLQKIPQCRCMPNECCADVLVVDFDMPFISGIEFLKNNMEKGCRAANKLIYSSCLAPDELNECITLGFETMKKTMDMANLMAYLEKAEQNIVPGRVLKKWFEG